MSLVLAIKNQQAIVVASDTDQTVHDPGFDELMPVSQHTVLLMAGNLEAVRPAVMRILPTLKQAAGAATVAKLVQAAFVVEVVPNLPKLKGRVELIIAGFDPIRHVAEPSLYYMDSAQDFYLKVIEGDVAAGGATAAVSSLLAGHNFADANTAHLKVLAKECISATKLRWPAAVKGRIKLGTITASTIQIQTL
jgi:20S proteasome alpha/beta subunit